MATHPVDPGPTAGSPSAVMTSARAGIAMLCDRLPASLSDAEIVAGVEAAQQLKATIAAWEALAVAEADNRALATKLLHHGSTGDW